MNEPSPHRRSILGQLGLVVERAGDVVEATGYVEPTLWQPGTTRLRLSVIATWADIVLGFVAFRALAPRPTTMLALDVELVDDVLDLEAVKVVGRIVKVGSSLAVCVVEFAEPGGRRLGVGHGLFMVLAGPSLEQPADSPAPGAAWTKRRSLPEPFAVSAGCERIGPGSARLPCSPHVLNPVKALNGGLLALVVEEAILAANPEVALLSLSLRYLRAIRTGPALAQANIRAGGITTVDVIDESSGELALTATSRLSVTDAIASGLSRA
jgi:acyl-coenzyme A thioesterase PaaI-like protein